MDRQGNKTTLSAPSPECIVLCMVDKWVGYNRAQTTNLPRQSQCHHSPMKGIEARESSVVAKGATFLPRRSPRPLASGSGDSSLNPRFICRAGVSWTLRPVGGFCLRTTSSRQSSAGGSKARVLASGRTTLGASEASGGNDAGDWAKLKVGSPPKGESRKESACRRPVRRWNDGL
jgi:hypothetical protein